MATIFINTVFHRHAPFYGHDPPLTIHSSLQTTNMSTHQPNETTSPFPTHRNRENNANNVSSKPKLKKEHLSSSARPRLICSGGVRFGLVKLIDHFLRLKAVELRERKDWLIDCKNDGFGTLDLKTGVYWEEMWCAVMWCDQKRLGEALVDRFDIMTVLRHAPIYAPTYLIFTHTNRHMHRSRTRNA